MKKTPPIASLLLLLAGCLALPVGGQEVVRNEQGQRIVVYPDGSWFFFESSSSTAGGQPGSFSPEDSTFQANFEEIEKMKREEDGAVLELIQVRLEQAECRQSLDSLLATGAAETTAGMVQARARWENALAREQQMLVQLEKMRQKRLFYGSILYLTGEAREYKIRSWEASAANVEAADRVPPAEEGPPAPPLWEDLLLTPPQSTCRFAFEGTDPATGQARKDVEPATIFSFTGKELQGYFANGDMFTCSGYLTSMAGGYLYLTLEVAVATKNAPGILGQFEAGSVLELVLLDGAVVRLLNQQPSGGTWLPQSNAYLYRCTFPIGNKEEKMLKSMELDKIRLRWSKAAEEFEVYELDFFARQFKCLER